MICKELTIVNKLGLHARAAARLVNCAGQYQSHIHIKRNGKRVNGKSIMGVLMLAASQGSTVTLEVQGGDEEAACQALETLIANRFGENE
jgi:phosphocarrier protein HPr